MFAGMLINADCLIPIARAQDFRIDDVNSARKADVTRLPAQTIEFSDRTSAGGIDGETALMPFAAWASAHPAEKKFLAL
ncbi:MAG TPA: hypothetical protein VEJ37_06680, partial [Xanthobacteraceae bacterium]|nr:hypothetical protein [Xanthobacteraceae bacterium]